jgi:hypothetical protein
MSPPEELREHSFGFEVTRATITAFYAGLRGGLCAGAVV